MGEKNIKKYYKKWAWQVVNSCLNSGKEETKEQQMNYRTKIFRRKEFYPVDCLGYGGELAIQPNGYVGNCHVSPRYYIRHISEWRKGVLIKNNPKIKRLIKRLPLYNDSCLNCKAISMCGGGCFWNAEEMKGSYLNKDERMCSLTKEIFEFLIWEESDKIELK